MKECSIQPIKFASIIAAIIVVSLSFQAGVMETASAQTKTKRIKVKSRAVTGPRVRAAKTKATPSPKVIAFFQLVSGKWAKITDDARLSMTLEQMNIAAIQCHSTKNLNIATATNITSISGTVSQKLSRILVYKKLATGLKRIDFKSRQSLLFPKLKIGKNNSGRDNFEVSNATIKITISFGKLKQGKRTIPVMIEGKALYLKCPKIN